MFCDSIEFPFWDDIPPEDQVVLLRYTPPGVWFRIRKRRKRPPTEWFQRRYAELNPPAGEIMQAYDTIANELEREFGVTLKSSTVRDIIHRPARRQRRNGNGTK